MDTESIGGGKMKIGVDAGCLGIHDSRLRVGVYHIVKNLLIQLGKIDHENEYLLYSFYPIDKSVMRDFGPHMKNVVVTPSRGWTKIWLPLRLLLDEPKIFLALNQAAPFRFLTSTYKTLGIFYDIAFEKYPQLYSYAASVKKHKDHSNYLAVTGNRFIAISQKTKDDIVEKYGIREELVKVSYPGIDSFDFSHTYKHDHPYFLFVGALKKVKNVATLLKAFQIASEKLQNSFDLLLAGGDKWLDPEITAVLRTYSSELKKRVKFLGAINSRSQLASLYKGAVAFVSPSLYEGFGLPFVEAMSIGTVVIGSNAGSVPEIVQDAGVLVNPTNIKALVDAMIQVAENKELREELIQKGKKRAKIYSWENFAKDVIGQIRLLSETT